MYPYKRKLSVTESNKLYISIQFIIKNIRNALVLEEYFEQFEGQFSTEILTLKLTVYEDAKLGIESYNLLGYAGRYNCFLNQLVELATIEAIESALDEKAINIYSFSALHAVLFEQEKQAKVGVLELLNKAGTETLSGALDRLCLGITPLGLALRDAEEQVACALITKVSSNALNTAAKVLCNGSTILELIIIENQQRPYPQAIVETLLKQLTPETKDFLMLTIGTLIQLLKKTDQDQPANDDLICLWVQNTSNKALNEIAKQKVILAGGEQVNLLTMLICLKHSKRVVDTLLSKLDEVVLNDLVLTSRIKGKSIIYITALHHRRRNSLGFTTHQPNLTVVYVIEHMSKQILIELLHRPQIKNSLAENKESESDMSTIEMQKDFFDRMATHRPLLNAFVYKLLRDGESITLPMTAIENLDEDNLKFYLEQHSEICIEQLKAFFHTFSKPKLSKANDKLNNEIACFVTVYKDFVRKFIAGDPAIIIMAYYVDNLVIIMRGIQELQMLSQKSAYEALPLTASQPKRGSFTFGNVLGWFNKPKSPQESVKPSEFLKKLNDTKKVIADFIETENKTLKKSFKTLKDIKLCFCTSKSGAIDVINQLESDLQRNDTAYLKACISLMIKVFEEATAKLLPPSPQLLLQTRNFGFDCLNSAAHGNGFFDAVVNQLALQDLGYLGVSSVGVKNQVINEMFLHPNSYRPLLDSNETVIDQFISENSWAFHIILAMSRQLKVNLVIIHSVENTPNIFVYPHAATTLYLGYDGQVYHSLKVNPHSPHRLSLKPYKIAAEMAQTKRRDYDSPDDEDTERKYPGLNSH